MSSDGDSAPLPGWARLPGGRLPNGADPAAYYAADPPPAALQVLADDLAWRERISAWSLRELRRREMSGEADADRAIVATIEARRERERLAAQLAVIEAAQLRSRIAGKPSPYEQAERYLLGCAAGVSEQGRNAQSYRVCLEMLRGFALTADVALDMIGRLYAPRCSPPLPYPELRRLVRWAAHARLPLGYRLR